LGALVASHPEHVPLYAGWGKSQLLHVIDAPGIIGTAAEAVEDSSLGDESSSDAFSDVSVEAEIWPPKAPVMRFKRLILFTNAYHSGAFDERRESRDLKAHNVKRLDPLPLAETEIRDPTVVWINMKLKMSIATESQVENGFPLILLYLLDAIYPHKVRWSMVDWNFKYKRATFKNYNVLQNVWTEVNMDKARGFRVVDTALRLEDMPEATLQDKLKFFSLAKRWFEGRIYHVGAFDPIARRQEIVRLCEIRGFTVVDPPWIETGELHGGSSLSTHYTRQQMEYAKMPEFKRLTWFLGSPEHQSM